MKTVCSLIVLLCLVAAIAPVIVADNCTDIGTDMEQCCKKVDADNKTMCQYKICNGTGECFAKGDPVVCDENPSPDNCTLTASTTTTTTIAPQTTQVKDNSSTAAPGPTTDSCTKITTSEECCKSDNDCHYINCTSAGDNPIKGCFSNNKSVADVCIEEKTTGTDICEATTIKPTSANPPGKESTTQNGTTPPTQPTCDNRNQTDCCAHNTTCQFVNCTDINDGSVHTGCHALTEDLNKFCRNNTWTNQCQSGEPTTSTTTSSTTTAAGGAAQPAKGGDEHKQHFDAASFIGGIVLCAGVIVIAYLGLKFYRARTERNYHTLH